MTSASVLALVAGLIAEPAAADASLTVTSVVDTYLVASQPSRSTIQVTGGTPPYSFTLSSGTLPSGVSLSSAGVLTGVPRSAGLFSITIRAQDAAGTSGSQVVDVPVVALDSVSTAPDGAVNGDAFAPSVSHDGSRIAFLSADTSLFPNSSATAPQVLVRDQSTGAVLDASVASDGTPASSAVAVFGLSENGRYVVMDTGQWRPDGVNAGWWVKDLTTGQIRLVSAVADQDGLNAFAAATAVSDDGTVAVYEPELYPFQVHVTDVSTGTTSVPLLCAGDSSYWARLTRDGRFVLFEEMAAECTGHNGVHTVLFDRTTGILSDIATCECVAPNGAYPYPRQGAVSSDGRLVAYWSDSQPGYNPGVFLLDRRDSSLAIIPSSSYGSGSFASNVELSDDGTRVATDVAGDGSRICFYDRVPSQLVCSAYLGGGGNGWALSGDGNSFAWDHETATYRVVDALSLMDASSPQKVYVALGDSYSSGEGNPLFQSAAPRCHRSQANAWPEIFALQTAQRLSLIACSGAKSTALYGAYQSQPAQLGTLQSLDARLVTITMGGNDLGFARILRACFIGNCQNTALPQAEADLPALKATMTSAYQDVRAASGGAPVLVVGYPSIFPAVPNRSQAHCPWLNPFENAGLVKLARDLDGTLSAAAATAGVQYKSTLVVLKYHELCTGSPWVNTITGSLSNSGQGHPNAFGQNAIAGAVTTYARRHQLV